MKGNEENRPHKTYVDIAALLIAIAAVVVSIFALHYAKESARSAAKSVNLQAAQLRPQLRISSSSLSLKKDVISGKFTVENLGPTTAVIDQVRVIVDSSESGTVFITFLEGAILHSGGRREETWATTSTFDYQGKKINYADRIKQKGGIEFEVNFHCNGMSDERFSDSILVSALFK